MRGKGSTVGLPGSMPMAFILDFIKCEQEGIKRVLNIQLKRDIPEELKLLEFYKILSSENANR
jgi:hypothetical protein